MKKPKGRVSKDDLFVSEQLRKIRRIRGASQVEVADNIGVTFQQFQKYEHGINRISAGGLARICRALQVPPSYFYPDTLNALIAPSGGLEGPVADAEQQ